MHIVSLKLINFRNYSRQELVLNPGINVFCGNNAQGKTNLLEALYYLAVARSFRTSQESEIVRLGNDFFYLKGIFMTRDGSRLAEIGYQQPHRLQIKENGKTFKRGDYIYRHPVVIFYPDDLFLVKEGPSVRRRFLDMECSRIKPLYYCMLRDYYRALRQRNRFLKENRGCRSVDPLAMEPWEKALIEMGSWIIKERIQFISSLEPQAQSHFGSLTAENEAISLRYRSTISFGENIEGVELYYKEQLEEGRLSEIRKGSTQCGPHLDDFTVMVNGLDVRKFGSQGQQRSAVLALKMGEVDLFKSAMGENAVLLLDDVFSELDEERRRRLFQFLSRRADQSFITTAVPLQDLKQSYPQNMHSFTVCGGDIKID